MTTPTPEPGPEMAPDDLEALRARLEAPAPPDGVLDAARTAAMAAYDERRTDAASPADVVGDIGSSRSAARSPAWYQRIPLGAAAAVVAVVALVGVATQIDLGSDDADTATATADSAGDSDDASTSADDSGVGRTSDEASEAPAEDFGSVAEGDAEIAPAVPDDAVRSAYDDIDALVEDFSDRYGDDGAGASVPATTAASNTDSGEASSCDAVAAADLEPSTVLRTEPVLLGLDGIRAPAIAVVYESDATGARVAVVDEASCTLLDDRAL